MWSVPDRGSMIPCRWPARKRAGDNPRMDPRPHTPCNIAASLPQLARERPDQVAMHCPDRAGRYRIAISYAQLDARSDAIAAGLARQGIVRGSRTVVMVRPTPEFFLLMYALFKLGAVPVLVDPGIDKRALKQCLGEAQPQAFIGIPLAMTAKALLGWAKSARIRITTGSSAWLADATLQAVEAAGQDAGPQLADTTPDEVAAVLFTSGSTGVPKGVVYRHRHFAGQIELLGRAFGMQPGGVDFPTFPPFALFAPALGLTAVIPDMDPTRPAQANPKKLHAAIRQFGATQLFGSPALMRVLADAGTAMPTVKRVTSAGAPVPPDTVAAILKLLPDDAQFWTPYGATECLPVSVIEGRELLTLRGKTEQGLGTCVGRPVPPNEVRLIAISDAPIARWEHVREVRAGQVGEITVAGPTATDSYFNRDAQTALAKISETLPDGSTRIVHRMGDLGWFDGEGRLWFCGRKSQRVVKDADTTLCTEQIEPVFNTHPQVRRTALVGVPRDKGADAANAGWAVLCVELDPGVRASDWPRIEAELRHLADGNVQTGPVDGFLHYPKPFPVDIRHNAKIGREKLALWAQREWSRLQRSQARREAR